MSNRLFIGVWLITMAVVVLLWVLGINLQLRLFLAGIGVGLGIYHTILGATIKEDVS